MDKNYETRHLFLAASIIIAIFGPIFYFFLPQTVGDILHHTKDVWFVYTPKENFTMFAIGFVLLFIATFLIFLLDIKKISIILGSLVLCMGLAVFFFASQSFLSLGDKTIAFSSLTTLEKYTYSWEAVDKMIHYRSEDGFFSEYEFVFKDGNRTKVKNDAYFREKSFKFEEKLSETKLNVELVIVEKPS